MKIWHEELGDKSEAIETGYDDTPSDYELQKFAETYVDKLWSNYDNPKEFDVTFISKDGTERVWTVFAEPDIVFIAHEKKQS